MKPIQLHYSEALIRRAVVAFWRRAIGWRYLVALALLGTSLAGFLLSGDRSWWVGMIGSMLAVALLFAAALYFVHYRASLTRFRRMRDPQATFEPGDQAFRITSDVGSTELVWSAVGELWCFPDFWLLFFSRAQFITLPTADLDSAARELILSRLKAHGAKVS